MRSVFSGPAALVALVGAVRGVRRLRYGPGTRETDPDALPVRRRVAGAVALSGAIGCQAFRGVTPVVVVVILALTAAVHVGLVAPLASRGRSQRAAVHIVAASWLGGLAAAVLTPTLLLIVFLVNAASQCPPDAYECPF